MLVLSIFIFIVLIVGIFIINKLMTIPKKVSTNTTTPEGVTLDNSNNILDINETKSNTSSSVDLSALFKDVTAHKYATYKWCKSNFYDVDIPDDPELPWSCKMTKEACEYKASDPSATGTYIWDSSLNKCISVKLKEIENICKYLDPDGRVGLTYVPPQFSCDISTGICVTTKEPSCRIPKSYCDSKGVSYDPTGNGDCYLSNSQDVAEMILGSKFIRGILSGDAQAVLDAVTVLPEIQDAVGFGLSKISALGLNPQTMSTCEYALLLRNSLNWNEINKWVYINNLYDDTDSDKYIDYSNSSYYHDMYNTIGDAFRQYAPCYANDLSASNNLLWAMTGKGYQQPHFNIWRYASYVVDTNKFSIFQPLFVLSFDSHYIARPKCPSLGSMNKDYIISLLKTVLQRNLDFVTFNKYVNFGIYSYTTSKKKLLDYNLNDNILSTKISPLIEDVNNNIVSGNFPDSSGQQIMIHNMEINDGLRFIRKNLKPNPVPWSYGSIIQAPFSIQPIFDVSKLPITFVTRIKIAEFPTNTIFCGLNPNFTTADQDKVRNGIIGNITEFTYYFEKVFLPFWKDYNSKSYNTVKVSGRFTDSINIINTSGTTQIFYNLFCEYVPYTLQERVCTVSTLNNNINIGQVSSNVVNYRIVTENNIGKTLAIYFSNSFPIIPVGVSFDKTIILSGGLYDLTKLCTFKFGNDFDIMVSLPTTNITLKTKDGKYTVQLRSNFDDNMINNLQCWLYPNSDAKLATLSFTAVSTETIIGNITSEKYENVIGNFIYPENINKKITFYTLKNIPVGIKFDDDIVMPDGWDIHNVKSLKFDNYNKTLKLLYDNNKELDILNFYANRKYFNVNLLQNNIFISQYNLNFTYDYILVGTKSENVVTFIIAGFFLYSLNENKQINIYYNNNNVVTGIEFDKNIVIPNYNIQTFRSISVLDSSILVYTDDNTKFVRIDNFNINSRNFKFSYYSSTNEIKNSILCSKYNDQYLVGLKSNSFEKITIQHTQYLKDDNNSIWTSNYNLGKNLTFYKDNSSNIIGVGLDKDFGVPKLDTLTAFNNFTVSLDYPLFLQSGNPIKCLKLFSDVLYNETYGNKDLFSINIFIINKNVGNTYIFDIICRNNSTSSKNYKTSFTSSDYAPNPSIINTKPTNDVGYLFGLTQELKAIINTPTNNYIYNDIASNSDITYVPVSNDINKNEISIQTYNYIIKPNNFDLTFDILNKQIIFYYDSKFENIIGVIIDKNLKIKNLDFSSPNTKFYKTISKFSSLQNTSVPLLKIYNTDTGCYLSIYILTLFNKYVFEIGSNTGYVQLYVNNVNTNDTDGYVVGTKTTNKETKLIKSFTSLSDGDKYDLINRNITFYKNTSNNLVGIALDPNISFYPISSFNLNTFSVSGNRISLYNNQKNISIVFTSQSVNTYNVQLIKDSYTNNLTISF